MTGSRNWRPNPTDSGIGEDVSLDGTVRLEPLAVVGGFNRDAASIPRGFGWTRCYRVSNASCKLVKRRRIDHTAASKFAAIGLAPLAAMNDWNRLLLR